MLTSPQNMHIQNGIYRNKITTFGNKINLGNTLSGFGVPTGWEYTAALRARKLSWKYQELRSSPTRASLADQLCRFSGSSLRVEISHQQ